MCASWGELEFVFLSVSAESYKRILSIHRHRPKSREQSSDLMGEFLNIKRTVLKNPCVSQDRALYYSGFVTLIIKQEIG